MKRVDDFKNIFLYKYPVDFRKSLSLVALAYDLVDLEHYKNFLFLFTNRRRNRVKAVYWDRTGFCLWYKVLEEEKFKWPKKLEQETVELTHEQVHWLLSGHDFEKMRPHKTVEFFRAS